jgi:hypothetical protein
VFLHINILINLLSDGFLVGFYTYAIQHLYLRDTFNIYALGLWGHSNGDVICAMCHSFFRSENWAAFRNMPIAPDENNSLF